MTIAFDAYSQSTYEEDPSWTHTPVGTPGGVLVFVMRYVSAADLTSADVTYGSLTLTEVSGSQSLKSTGETNALIAYSSVEGDTIPTGAQTVSVIDTGQLQCACYTVTSDEDMEVNVVEVYQNDAEADPSYTLELGGTTSFVAECWGSGRGNVTVNDPWSGWTSRGEFDLGTAGLGTYSYDTIGSSDPTYGFDTQTAADDVNLSVVAFSEVVGGGGGSALPLLNAYYG